MNSQQAINLLKDLEQRLDDYYGLNDKGKAAFRMAITALELFGNAEQLPSANLQQTCNLLQVDCISRQDAMQIGNDLQIGIEGYEQYNQAVLNYTAEIAGLPPKKQDISKARKLIDADALKEDCDAYYDRHMAESIAERIDAQTAVNLQEITASWIPVTNGRGGNECSRCHNYAPAYQTGEERLTNYCPCCGAKMVARSVS